MRKIYLIAITIALISSCSMSDEVKNMNNGYVFARESKYSQVIEKEGGTAVVPCTVIDFDYNSDYIVAAQIDNAGCLNDFEPNAKLTFWIINCKTNEVYSNLSIIEYFNYKKKFGISKKLKLDIEFE